MTPAPHRPPRKPAHGLPASPDAAMKEEIKHAATAFAVLCEALTEAVEVLTEELKDQIEEGRRHAK